MTNSAHPTLPGRRSPIRRVLLFCLAIAAAAAFNCPSSAAQSPGIVTARLVSLTPHLHAYAQVEPVAALAVNAPETGVLSGLTIVPGTHVRAGQTLASLCGPAIQSLLRQDESNLRSARTQLRETTKSLTIQRQQLRAHLTTRQSVHQVESAVAKAQAAVDNAQSQLAAVRQMASITAPVSGVVLSLNTSNQERVSAGQTILTLQSSHALWLRATYYGSHIHTVRLGMTGSFQPADNGPPIPVRVRSIAAAISPNGGQSVFLTPLHPQPRWLNGEFGTVILNQPVRKMVAVPTRALVLDHGKWWVMVHTSHGNRPRQVTPGPARGWNTFITSGLPPGSRVIVNNAYLLFHSSIAEQYQSAN